MRFLLASSAISFVIVIVFFFAAPGFAQQAEEHAHSNAVSGEGLGRVHMDISCSPAVDAKFDRALALLHNFWYARALDGFQQVSNDDPDCAMAYWGAAMTYNHPFWDSPPQADETAAWALSQKGMSAQKASARETLYLAAVAALYNDAGAGSKSARDRNYRDAMAAVYAQYPDDETALFYGLSILGAVPEGSQGFEQQGQAAKLFEAVYASHPDHPGVLHYLIHAYDDPEHAQPGLKAARAYAQAAAAVPHALHMPSHIFTRLGDWEESAATNLKGWEVSEADVKRAGESGAYRDFHNLNYLEYAYIQLGRYRDAQHTVDIIAAQYQALPDKATALDTPELQARHVRGRTIYAVPDRVVYGYFDMSTRLSVESGRWDEVAAIPLVVRSRDFMAVKLQWEAKAAAVRKDAGAAGAATAKLVALSQDSGQHPFAKLIITVQATEAQAFAAQAAGDADGAVTKLKEAVAVEDSIDDLSQPPYPVIPARELLGTLLLELNRPADAQEQFLETLKRTPGRPKAIYGLAQAARATGDNATARQRYQEFLRIWKDADPDRPEIAAAKQFLAKEATGTK
jgi:tetratricopeptide (TPR) repeat protein